MDNKEIIEQIKLYASILELNDESAFKIRSYQTAVFNLDKLDEPLAEKSQSDLEKLPGVGKAIAAKISDAIQHGMFRQLKEILETTPAGLIDMLGIEGLGVKKVRVLWQELGIESTEQLLEACENNQIAQVKGFGAKTQENIKKALLFKKANAQKLRYANAEPYVHQLESVLKDHPAVQTFCTVGQIRRRLEIIDQVQVLVASQNQAAVLAHLDQCDFLEKAPQQSGVFAWRGQFKGHPLPLEVRLTKPNEFAREAFIHSGSPAHLSWKSPELNATMLQLARSEYFDSEEAIYKKVNLPYLAPELREGSFEWEQAQNDNLPDLLEVSQLKGILHAHSTYSDGKHTLEEMALACKEAGYEYLGMTDHSKASFYANGLYENRVKKQHHEIEALNEKLAPFKIFKGIESDILADGSLDYENDVLASFDFIIASVHSGSKVDEAKMTERMIKAIENPYTTILGHPSGRLLLRREGYPINHEKIIDACAANQVVIEINASPWRLDLDWRWVHYALNKGVMLSINPDAHHKDNIHDVQYGVYIGRKGGLSADKTLNTLSLAEIEVYFEQRKNKQ